MSYRKFNFPSLFILMIFLAACSPRMTTYKSSELGLRVDVPDSWELNEAEGTITITSKAQVLESGTVGEEAGVTIAMATSEQYSGASNDPKDILAAFMAYYIMQGNSPDIVQEGEPKIYQIHGLPAATATYSGEIDEEEGVYTVTVIVRGEKFVLVLGADGSANNSYANTITKITKSINID